MEQRARATTPASSLSKRRGSETGSSSDRDQKMERGDGIEGIQRPPGAWFIQYTRRTTRSFGFLFFCFCSSSGLVFRATKRCRLHDGFFREGGSVITIITILIIIYLSHWGGLIHGFVSSSVVFAPSCFGSCRLRCWSWCWSCCLVYGRACCSSTYCRYILILSLLLPSSLSTCMC